MEKYFEDIKKSLKKLVSIDSVQGEAEEGKPFGKGVYEALRYTLGLAEELGFKTNDYDGYIGEAVFGDGEEEMAVLCHLDVVPAGKLSDWKYPPFSATEADGKIYGRGTTDDKGPAIVCLYCLKALKDEGFKPKKKIRLIFGCNEESGWKCIEHYKKVAKMPDFGFSPDADFPVLYAEKGILHVRFAFPAGNGLKSLEGGSAINVVCDRCEAIAPINAALLEKYNVKSEGGKLVTYGKSAHGSTPEKGVNAIEPMLRYLEEEGVVSGITRELFDDAHGLKKLCDETGNLTMSPDVASFADGKIYVSVDIRYPATLSGEVVTDILDEIGEYVVLSHQKPLFNDKNSFLITTLLDIYNSAMHTSAKPMAIGGGTYARALKEGTAFGPEMPGEDCAIHQPNEFVSIENLRLQCVMYKQAIKRLSE